MNLVNIPVMSEFLEVHLGNQLLWFDNVIKSS